MAVHTSLHFTLPRRGPPHRLVLLCVASHRFAASLRVTSLHFTCGQTLSVTLVARGRRDRPFRSSWLTSPHMTRPRRQRSRGPRQRLRRRLRQRRRLGNRRAHRPGRADPAWSAAPVAARGPAPPAAARNVRQLGVSRCRTTWRMCCTRPRRWAAPPLGMQPRAALPPTTLPRCMCRRRAASGRSLDTRNRYSWSSATGVATCTYRAASGLVGSVSFACASSSTLGTACQPSFHEIRDMRTWAAHTVTSECLLNYVAKSRSALPDYPQTKSVAPGRRGADTAVFCA